MLSLIPSIVILGSIAVVAISLAWNRSSPLTASTERASAARALAAVTLLQAGHFGEELATGFHQRLPALFGLDPMPLQLFVLFNVAWIGVWIGSVPGVRRGRRWAFSAAWFLAIAGMVNGIAHPALAASVQAYFPGLVSAPVVGFASVWLWQHLWTATRPPAPAA